MGQVKESVEQAYSRALILPIGPPRSILLPLLLLPMGLLFFAVLRELHPVVELRKKVLTK